MNKADNPFFHPSPVRFVSREGRVCLVLELALHLLFAGWIGWVESGEKAELTAPITGMLVSGSGGMGGHAGDRAGNGVAKGEGQPEKRPAAARVRTGSDRSFSGKSDTGRERATGRESAAAVPGKTVSEKSLSGEAIAEKTGAGDFAGREKRNGNEAGTSAGTVAGSNGNGGHETGGSGKGGNGSGSGGTAGPYADAALFSNPKPHYPAVSRRMGEEGVVVLSVYILADGRVADVKVKRSSGFPRLDESALKTVRHWRYVPAKKDGRAVAFRYVQPVRFSLND